MANPTLNQGLRGTSILATESRRARDVAPSLAKLEPDAGPLTTLTLRMGSKKAVDAEFEHFEDELNPRFDSLGGALTGVATSMTVVTYKMFKKGDLVRIANAEIVRVTATPSSTTVSISRAFGETAAAAANQGDKLEIIGSAFEEGTGRASIITTQRVQKINYCGILKTTWGFTETELNTDQLAGQDQDEEKAKKLIEHKRLMELTFLFSELKKDTTTGTHPIRSTRGVIPHIATNVVDAGGDLTEAEWEDWLRRCFRYGSREKVVFCSPKVITVVNGFSRGKLITKSDESTYGVTMTQYQNAGRRVMLVEQVLFENSSLTDLTGPAGYALCLDMKNIQMRHMRSSPVLYKDNVQANDDDSREDQYLSEVGLQVQQERTHGLLTGVTG